ncbi:hypothetical protein QTN25_004713 [Entamoeba marina]
MMLIILFIIIKGTIVEKIAIKKNINQKNDGRHYKTKPYKNDRNHDFKERAIGKRHEDKTSFVDIKDKGDDKNYEFNDSHHSFHHKKYYDNYDNNKYQQKEQNKNSPFKQFLTSTYSLEHSSFILNPPNLSKLSLPLYGGTVDTIENIKNKDYMKIASKIESNANINMNEINWKILNDKQKQKQISFSVQLISNNIYAKKK